MLISMFLFFLTFSYEFNSDEFEHCKHKLVFKSIGHLFDHCKTCSLLLNEYYEKLFVLEGWVIIAYLEIEYFFSKFIVENVITKTESLLIKEG